MRTLPDPLHPSPLSWHQLPLPPNEATSCEIIRFPCAFLQMLRHGGIINACHSEGDFILQRDAPSTKTLIEGRMDDTMITIFHFHLTIRTWWPSSALGRTRAFAIIYLRRYSWLVPCLQRLQRLRSINHLIVTWTFALICNPRVKHNSPTPLLLFHLLILMWRFDNPPIRIALG